MKQIVELSKQASPNHNQIVRWVQNKEYHAGKVRDATVQYFMAQRVKPGLAKGSAEEEAYIHKLKLLHLMVIYTMKCKQTTDLADAEKLGELVNRLEKAYFGK
jgi:hypothetical protein